LEEGMAIPMKFLSLIKDGIIPIICLWAVACFQEMSPTRLELINFFDGNVTSAYYTEKLFNISIFFIVSFAYGWLTMIVIGHLKDRPLSVREIFNSVKRWFGRSALINLMTWMGLYFINLFVIDYSNSFLSAMALVLAAFWVILTFTFYPKIIASEKPIHEAFFDAFAGAFDSIKQWFHLFVILFIISGGITVFKDNVGNLGWNIHILPIGGYSFYSYWLKDLFKVNLLASSNIITGIASLAAILIALFIKNNLTEILFKSGNLSRASQVESNDNQISETLGNKVNEKYFKPLEHELEDGFYSKRETHRVRNRNSDNNGTESLG
jgi:hypothetical protein